MRPSLTLWIAAGLLAGCAAPGIDPAVREVNQSLGGFTAGALALRRTDEEAQAARTAAQRLLAQPLAQGDAVQLALANDPAVQALLSESAAELAQADQGARVANPVFSFERLRSPGELEIGRLLAFGLFDLLSLPQRRGIAQARAGQTRVRLAAGVVEKVGRVRQAWVRAVAAQESLRYARQVNQAAQAGAELARRMLLAGNITKLQRAREHAFYADAAAQLATARHAATGAREALARELGLDEAQAQLLQLPERLPDLPSAPRAPAEVAATATEQRLDVRLARTELDVAGKAQGLDLMTSFIDVELGVRRDTVFDNAAGERHARRGFELDLRLPLFDWGDARRSAMNARSLAAAHRYDSTARAASSQLREDYSAYRTAFDLARHYRDEIVPLRKTMADENLLRYNGMLIGVFELLAETRAQVASVMAAIEAQQQFWLADAALSASIIGRPMPAALATPARAGAADAAPAH